MVRIGLWKATDNTAAEHLKDFDSSLFNMVQLATLTESADCKILGTLPHLVVVARSSRLLQRLSGFDLDSESEDLHKILGALKPEDDFARILAAASTASLKQDVLKETLAFNVWNGTSTHSSTDSI